MSLKLIGNNGDISDITLNDWKVNKSNANGTLSNIDIGDLTINYPLPIISKSENYDSCKVFLFKNKFKSKEDHGFQITIDDSRKGVIFPIKIYSNKSVLPAPGASKDSDFLLRFLHIGFYHLLKAHEIISNPIKFDDISKITNLKIEDFYDDETVVYLYHEDNLADLKIFRYYPSFLKFGYVPIIKATDYNEIEVINIKTSKHPLYTFGLLDVLEIKNPNSNLVDEKYINQLFTSILKNKLNSTARFLLLYQVIELLIDKIALEHFLSKHPYDLDTYYMIFETRTAKSYRDVYDNINEIQKKVQKTIDPIKEEFKRINKLINEKAKLEINDYVRFVEISKKIIGNRSCSTLPDYIYQLRNKIIHDFHNLSNSHDNIDDLLGEANIEFEKIISDVIINYQ